MVRPRLFPVLLLLLSVVALASCGGHASQGTPVPSGSLVLTNGTVIDGTGAEPVPNGVVIVNQGRVWAVGHPSDFEIPAGAQIIDVGGGTILPGLIDSHLHFSGHPRVRRELLLEGITSACDLGSPLEDMTKFDETQIDGLSTTRDFRAGPMITVPNGKHSYTGDSGIAYEVTGPDSGRTAVADLVERGADYIKIYLDPWILDEALPMLGQDQVNAIVDEAHNHGLLVRAHARTASEYRIVLDGGADVTEHAPVPRLVESTMAEIGAGSDPQARFKALSNPQLEMMEPLLVQMVDQGVVMVPTLASYAEWVIYAMPEPVREPFLQASIEVVGRFHEMGGVVALGTDSGAYGTSRNLVLVEMGLLQQAGLTAMEAIQAATVNAAFVCGQGETLGTLEPGKLADLIVVEGNPLDDPDALRRLSWVILGGQVVRSPL